jgi:hypothetical protein
MSLFQNPVGFSQALVVFRPTACKTTVFQGYCFKAEVLKQPQVIPKLQFLEQSHFMIIQTSIFKQ